ncbi:MAG: motility protein A, partial [Lachnospiraceae bacterium]|nr:motility protein A [Lachnospiraceae bacterium]
MKAPPKVMSAEGASRKFSIAAKLLPNTIPDYIAGFKSILLTFKSSTLDVAGVIRKIIDLSNVARKEGLLSLE